MSLMIYKFWLILCFHLLQVYRNFYKGHLLFRIEEDRKYSQYNIDCLTLDLGISV